MDARKLDGTPPAVRRPAKAAAAGQAAPAAERPMARDRVALSRRAGMGELPQSAFGVRLTPAMQPYAADLDTYVAESEAAIDRLAERLKGDPLYQRAAAPGAWSKLSATERLAVAARVGQLQGELLGFRPAKAHLIWEADTTSDGGFDDDTGRLDLNRHAAAFQDLGQFLNTVVHEQFHCYQRHLVRSKGALDAPRQAAAEVYKLEARDYHEAPEDSKARPAQYAAYRSQPTEAHAFMMGQRLFRQLFGD